ncbi:MAG: hypothetical protein AAB269_00505, partial [Bacteroidota bacterium]
MGYIFETEIIAIVNTVRGRTIGESESIRLRDVLRADIHPAIKAYFMAEVKRILNDERALELRSKRLPYELPETASLQRQIDIVLVHNYHFEQQDFESLVDEAVHFQFNYLCRPQWTLLNFIYGTQRKASASDLQRKLKYCVDYTYFPDLIRRYVEERGLAEITYEEFKTLLERIDREVVAQHSSLELARMTRALLGFVDAARQTPPDEFEQPKLPINAAIVFFEDKQLDDIKARLELERDKNKVQDVTVSELATLIEKVRTGNEDAKIEASLQDLLPSIARREEKRVQLDNIVVSMDETQQHAFTPAEESSTPGVPEGKKADQEPLPPADILNNLYEEISDSDRKLFVKKLFRRDGQ